VWQYWWWSLFFFFTIFYFLLFFDIFFFKNTKQKAFVLTSLKSNGRWGDLAAGLLPVYWCINILLNSNMILKVLEWQTETSFCTIRIRGKQWYWVYKLSLRNKNNLKGCDFILGNKNILTFKNSKNTDLSYFFFKKKFLKKINVDFSSFYFKNSNLSVSSNNFDSLNFLFKKNKIFFLKNDINFDSFFFLKKNSKNLKKFNRGWLTIQQQPKTELNYTYKIPFFFDKKIGFYKKLNCFLKNNILVKNRLISVDNILYLPSRKNITVITNSFDVAHSWFVPGLGLKFDCIPGRSTHNSLFISKPGYYFGHCAEVCGRFHHHMPIKIIALSVDHFIYYYNVTVSSFRKKN
jgi:heme/copper-type cytochrome/quinol oxidase subunit 2